MAPLALTDCVHKVFQPQLAPPWWEEAALKRRWKFGEAAVGYGDIQVSARAWDPPRRHSKMKDMLSWGGYVFASS